MFKLRRTFTDPTKGENAQRGFPAPGAGAQTTGAYTPAPQKVPRTSSRPTKGKPSDFGLSPDGKQRGFPSPTNPGERREPGSMPNVAVQYGGSIPVVTPYFSRGAAAVVQNFGKVLTNPIGAGIYAPHRPKPSYGQPGQYYDQAIWWTTQNIPTSVDLTGLTSPDQLAAILSSVEVQAVVRVG